MIVPGITYGFDPVALKYQARGRPDLPAEAEWVFRQTQPTALNSGVPAGTVLTDYDEDIVTPRTVIIDVPGTHVQYKNMGNVRLSVRADNVYIGYNEWLVTNNPSSTAMVTTDHSAARNVTVEFCTIINLDQMGYNYNGVQGHDVAVYRCRIEGTVDGVRPNGGGNVRVYGCIIGPVGWWATAPGKPALNSGDQTHSDCIQTTYAGVEVIGNTLLGYASEAVGTGTPGAHSDSGTPTSWFTQAEGNASRASKLNSVMTNPAYSYDGVAHGVGGILCCFMINIATGPTTADHIFEDNWLAGGSVQVNALNTNLTSPVGTFYRNKSYDDARYKSAGRSIVFNVNTGLAADIPTTGENRNYFIRDGATIPRVDG